MIHAMIRGGLLAAVLFVPSAAYAQLTINFDTNPLGTPIASGNLVNTAYAGWGVQFVAEGGNCGISPNVYANNNQPAGFGTSPNVVSPCPHLTASDFSENDYGVIRAIFDFEATDVCISSRANTGQIAMIRALDESDNVLDTTLSTAPGAVEDLCVNSATPIRAVEFAGNGDDFARFDTLVIFGPGVPVMPNPLLLTLAAALAAAGGLMVRRRLSAM